MDPSPLADHKPAGSRLPSHAIQAGAGRLALHLAAGMILGAFASRLLAEWPLNCAWRVPAPPPLQWLFCGGHTARWALTLVLTLGSGIAFVAVYALRARRQDLKQPNVALSPIIPFFLLGLYLLQPETNLLQAGILMGGSLALSLLLSDLPGLEAEWPIWVLLFLVSLITYLNTLMPAVGTRDGYELQAVSATLGFAHPTGYPLFPILGRLWIAILPFGSIAWRINLLCALFAAASVPMVYGTARRVLGQPTVGRGPEPFQNRPAALRAALRFEPFWGDSRAAAAWSALLFGFSHTLWAQASQPEKYTLNALFVALVLYVALGTDSKQPIADPEQTVPVQPRGPHPHLRWLGFVYGLSLTHHRTMLMLAPALALYLLWRDPGLLKRRAALRKEWLPTLGIALAPLLIYLYIPWRAYAQGWAMTVGEFLRYIAGVAYGPAVRLMDWATPERSRLFGQFVVAQFGYLGIALGMLGLVGLALRRQWQYLACTVVAYAAYYFWGTVWYAYYNDVNSFIPNHMILAIWIGSGAMTLGALIEYLAELRPRVRAELRAVFWSVAALMPMSLLWTNGPLVDRSDEWEMTRWGENAIRSELVHPLDLAPNATILADRTKHPPLDYFARIEQRRPDIEVVILGDEQAYLDRLAQDMAQNKPIYLARFLPGLEGPYHLSSNGLLVKVSTAPLTEVGELEGTPTLFTAADGTTIELLGYSIQRGERDDPRPYGENRRAGETLHITLFWRAQAPLPANYHVTLRLVGATRQEWWSSSDHPVSGMYPTAAWKPGEIVADWHEVPIGEAFPPLTYTLEVGLFPPFSPEGLSPAHGDTPTTDGTQGPWAPLTTLTVTPAPANPSPAHRLRAVAPGRLQLLGYDLLDQAPPAGRVTLRLYWQALDPLPDPDAPCLCLQIGTRVIAKNAAPAETHPERGWTWSVPGKGEYPTSSWTPGTTVLTEHLLTMPSEQGQAVVQIAVREDELVSFYPRWLAPQSQVLSLPPIRVSGRPPSAPDATNFGDRILLLDNDLGQRTLPPGAPLECTIRWQGMQPMDADYTLFLHILAPDGTLKGQIDVWPRDGTHPTSRWRPGEAFEDRYLLYIAPDAPPGDYQVAIGWYLLETMQRLPVLDAQGRAIDDKVLLSGLTVQ